MIDSRVIMGEVEEIQSALDKTDSISKILTIKEQFEATAVEDWQMEVLVDRVFTLCVLLDNLSELKDSAYIKSETFAEQYKAEVRDSYLELKAGEEKMTEAMAKALAEKEHDDTKQMSLKADYQARRLRSLYENCDRIVSYTQTKVKTMVDNKIRANIPNN